MEQKSDRERWGDWGGGGGAEGETERAYELRNTDWWEEKKEEGKKKKKKPVSNPTLEKEEGFQFQISRGMNGKTGVPGGKTHWSDEVQTLWYFIYSLYRALHFIKFL